MPVRLSGKYAGACLSRAASVASDGARSAVATTTPARGELPEYPPGPALEARFEL